MELLAPAGGFKQLEAAIYFGADAVYLGGERFGLRQRADNFSDSDLADAVTMAHAAGVKVHVTVNALMHEKDIVSGDRGVTLRDYLRFIQDCGADAVIAGDLATIVAAREVAPNLEVHVSTQMSCANHEAALAYYKLGAKRIVPARELSLSEIAEMKKNFPDDLQLEVFAHGAMCMAYSGRCIISNYLNGRDANKGHCTQPCRWNYVLEEEKRPGVHFPVVEDSGFTSIFSSKDLMMLEHLDELEAAGVDSIKIEGRVKSSYYVATVVNAYRHVLDGEDPAEYLPELDAVSHRPYHTGFFYGQPDQTVGEVEYTQTKILCGTPSETVPADSKDELFGQGGRGDFVVRFQLNNKIDGEQVVEVLSPNHPVRSFSPHVMRHVESGELVRTATRAGEDYECLVPFEISRGDIMRRQILDSEQRCN
ncbi:MAG: peptidase U32 family protein [Coriobacteriales bacterium]|jgi:putative protease